MNDIRNVPIWILWPQLGFLFKIFFVILVAVSARTLASMYTILKRANSYKENDLHALRIKLRRMEGLLQSTFLAFGFFFFLVLPNATFVFGDGNGTPLFMILRNFCAYFAFAANVLFVLWVLHLLCSLTSRRIDNLELQGPDLA